MNWVKRAQTTGFLGAAVMGAGAVIIAATLLTTVTRLRMYELRDSLQSFNEKNDDLRNVTLLSRIALINQSAFSGSRETAASYKQEAESALIAIRQSHAKDMQASLIDRIALPLLNAFNFVTGLPRLKLGNTPEQEIILDLAFQFETYREYTKAVRGYDVYTGEFRLKAEEREFALLHRGFCQAMLNQFDAALADFDAVAKTPGSKSAWIAQKLIQFLTALQAKIRFIEAVSDPAQRGELYYDAAAYLKALENFAKVDNNRQSEKIRFLTARALEETGRSKEALTLYRALIAEQGGSAYAVNANRRMYLLGTFLGHDEKLAQESKKNSETVVRDKEFMSAVTHLEKSATQLYQDAAAERATKTTEMTAAQKLVAVEEPAKQNTVVLPPVKPATAPVVLPAAKPKQPNTINLKNEKIAQQSENLTENTKEQLIKKQNEKIDKLTMVDGNVFFGVVYKETEDTVFLYSVLGNLELDKSNVEKREKVAGQNALK
jgi:tetratricopeptide (TPR) repeat protein